MKSLETNIGYQKFKKIEKEFDQVKRVTLPLCAAENVMSPFSKVTLSGNFQERYIMNGILNFNVEDNFIGSNSLFQIYQLIQQQCELLFDATYADARTLSGMNCITSLLMSITEQGDTIMVSDSECGGHQSMKIVCQRLGLKIIDMPYDYKNFNIDYSKIYEMLKKEEIKFFLYAPSDIIQAPDYSKLILPEFTVFIYDASQTLGLIAGKQLENPLSSIDNCILIGGTHKTIPGPANGIIMTKSDQWANKIDSTISPKYIRHTQMHQIISLLFTLFELEEFGEEYAKTTIQFSQQLGFELLNLGMNVPLVNNKPSWTHQIFIKTSENKMKKIYQSAFKNNVTLNKKSKLLFDNHGIRLGTQEIARLDWKVNPIFKIAKIISDLQYDKNVQAQIEELELPSDLKYTFKKEGD